MLRFLLELFLTDSSLHFIILFYIFVSVADLDNTGLARIFSSIEYKKLVHVELMMPGQ